MFLFYCIHQVVHYHYDLQFEILKDIFIFVAPGYSEPSVSSLLPTPSSEPAATAPSQTPSPPEPSTPCLASSATVFVSLEEDSIQDTAQPISIGTPGLLFDP